MIPLNTQVSSGSAVENAVDHAAKPVNDANAFAADAVAANQVDAPERVHVDARGVSLAIIATVVLLFAINTAEKISRAFIVWYFHCLHPQSCCRLA